MLSDKKKRQQQLNSRREFSQKAKTCSRMELLVLINKEPH